MRVAQEEGNVSSLGTRHSRYDLQQLVLEGEISKLKVFELDKYRDKHNLLTGTKALKDDKTKCIISRVLRNDYSATHTNAVACASYKQRECVDESDRDDDNDDKYDDDYDDDDERSDSEEDLVLNDLDESAESGDSEKE